MVLYYSTVHKATPVDNMIATMSYISPLIYLRVSVTQNMLPGTILIQKVCVCVY